MRRRPTNQVRIGPVTIGGGLEGTQPWPVAVQSMCDTDTNDIEASLARVGRLRDAGCRIVRLTVPGMREVESIRQIAQRVRAAWPDVAIVGDVHFLPSVALSLAGIVDKIRINPGNYAVITDRAPTNSDPARGDFAELIEKCRTTNTAIRIGVNHGSVGQEDMTDAAMRFLRVCRQMDFDQVVVSMKSSGVEVMVDAYRKLVAAMDREGMHYPLHLGVTEAGNGLDGVVKSAVGIGALLVDGIGDTIRVSLTGPPEEEIPVAQAILQACGLDNSRAEMIACPGCGRTLFELGPVFERVKAAVGHLGGLKIAVMGCIVNGPGEMADADYGYVGAGRGKVTLYRGSQVVKRNIPEAEALDELVALLKADGEWVEQ